MAILYAIAEIFDLFCLKLINQEYIYIFNEYFTLFGINLNEEIYYMGFFLE